MIGRWIDGGSLPDGQFCLTFDDGPGESDADGPGPRTVEVAEYLADQAVPATFFLCGKYIAELPRVPARLRALGHAVGNHTTTHPRLPEMAAKGGDIVAELTDTARLLGAGDGEKIWFRPPYGDYDDHVAMILDTAPELDAHAGPVMWNVGGYDWSYWRDGRAPEECAAAVLDEAERKGRGIILLHDCTADSDEIRAANRTYEAVRLLVPELRERAYTFVTLDEVP